MLSQEEFVSVLLFSFSDFFLIQEGLINIILKNVCLTNHYIKV